MKEIVNENNYTVMELFTELATDPSWEPDLEKRNAITFGLLYTLLLS